MISECGTPLRVVVTGASGFVGGALFERLKTIEGVRPISIVRSQNKTIEPEGYVFIVPDLSLSTDWSVALKDTDVIVHAAARVHVMKEDVTDALAEFRKVNVEGTVNLAMQAARAGVKRFIFISSVKVNGESTVNGCPFLENDLPAPSDPYGISKQEAEESLQKISAETGMEIVIIRPTLIYGEGVKANFESMMKWLKKGIPLPFGAIHNKRSLVSLDNLIDLILVCLKHPKAAGEIFLVSDDYDMSTTELLVSTADALGVKTRLIPIPSSLIAIIASVCGRRALAQRLCGSLQVDISKAKLLLGWHPPMSTKDALSKTAKYYLKQSAD